MLALPLLLFSQIAATPLTVEAQSNPVTASLADLFIEACIRGEVRLTPGNSVEKTRSQLSTWHREDLKEYPSTRFFEIAKPAWALLMIAKPDAPTSEGVVEVCALETNGHDIATAWKRIARAVSGGIEAEVKRNVGTYEIIYPARRYRVYVSSRWLETTVVDEAGAARMAKEQPKADRGRATVRAR